MRKLVATLGALVIVVAGLLAAPAGVANAADCSTLLARIAAWNAEANRYNSQVVPLNASGSITVAQKTYYDGWQGRLAARKANLQAELRACDMGSGPAPSASPTKPTPSASTPARSRLAYLPPRVVRGVARGSITYGGTFGGTALSVKATINSSILGKGSGPASIRPKGLGTVFHGATLSVPGYLLPQALGGSGAEKRNIIAMTPGANQRIGDIATRVRRAVLAGGTVNWTVWAWYPISPLNPAEYFTVTATGGGLNINVRIMNS